MEIDLFLVFLLQNGKKEMTEIWETTRTMSTYREQPISTRMLDKKYIFKMFLEEKLPAKQLNMALGYDFKSEFKCKI